MLAVLQKQTIKQVQLEKVTRTFVQIRDACRLNCRNIHARDLPLAVSVHYFFFRNVNDFHVFIVFQHFSVSSLQLLPHIPE